MENETANFYLDGSTKGDLFPEKSHIRLIGLNLTQIQKRVGQMRWKF